MYPRWMTGLFLALALVLGVGGIAIAGENFEGKVVAAAEKHMTLDHQDAQQVFTINAETKITLDGSPATWGDLKAGYTAMVSAEKEGDQLVAKEISAFVDD